MKICFVSHTSRLGGAERSLVETLAVLRSRNVDCAVLLPGRGPLAKTLEQMGVPSRTLPYKWWAASEGKPAWKRVARTLWNLAWVLPAALWVRRQRADLVYTNTIVTPLGALAARLAGRRHVWHIRELGHQHNRMIFDVGEARAMAIVRRLSALCLVNSHCVAARYRDVLAPREPVVVYQGVQLEPAVSAAPAPPAPGLRCVVVGALSPAKRQEEAIRALARLADEQVRASLEIVGAGDPGYERELRALAGELGVAGSVAFLGQVESAAPWLRAADVVIHCSRHEAFGRVTVEGMLAGKPVVGARSAGTAELIEEGVNGRLYEPGRIDQLVAILRDLAAKPDARERLGRAARTWAEERFTGPRFGDELLARLRPLVEPQNGR